MNETPLSFKQIVSLLSQQFGNDVVIEQTEAVKQPFLVLATEKLAEVCLFLHDDARLYFDMLSCITGIDNGAEAGTMEVAYNLYSIPYEVSLLLKVRIPRNQEGEPLPSVPTLCDIWGCANWLERETYDLLGIRFEGHPDLRRILLPNDWEGYPLRKDYKLQAYYHGVKVAY